MKWPSFQFIKGQAFLGNPYISQNSKSRLHWPGPSQNLLLWLTFIELVIKLIISAFHWLGSPVLKASHSSEVYAAIECSWSGFLRCDSWLCMVLCLLVFQGQGQQPFVGQKEDKAGSSTLPQVGQQVLLVPVSSMNIGMEGTYFHSCIYLLLRIMPWLFQATLCILCWSACKLQSKHRCNGCASTNLSTSFFLCHILLLLLSPVPSRNISLPGWASMPWGSVKIS